LIGTSWIVEIKPVGTRDGKPFQATDLYNTSLRITPNPSLQQVRDRWSIEGWHWMSDTQTPWGRTPRTEQRSWRWATLRTAALNLLRQAGIQSIRAGMRL
jgi:hypothetical protein